MLRFRFKACTKCRGDLALDEGDWICLQCGTYYYVGLYRETHKMRPPPVQATDRREVNEKVYGLPWPGDGSLLPLGLATALLAQGTFRR